MRYLRDSSELRAELNRLFSGSGSKWAVVGFVGYDAIDHLPADVRDLQIVCWPKVGGTNPDGVRRLIEAGIAVYFCDRLHQKLYWRKNLGLIVSSANLTTNALGDGRLHEFGVYCDDPSFDIWSVLTKLEYVPVTSDALSRLDVEHAALMRSSPGVPTQPSAVQDFATATAAAHPRRWKLVTWNDWRVDNSHIESEIEAEFGTKTWVNDNDVQCDTFEVGDFALQVEIDSSGFVTRSNARWLFVDHVVRSRAASVVVQRRRLDARNPPPFALDSRFKKCFKDVFNASSSWDEITDDDCVVRPAFVEKIWDAYAASSGDRR